MLNNPLYQSEGSKKKYSIIKKIECQGPIGMRHTPGRETESIRKFPKTVSSHLAVEESTQM